MIFSSLKEYEAMKPGLSRIRKFLKAAGDPHEKFKSIHIAGTNGKGSVAVMTAGILKESGYRTGLYTSPHLIDITERIKVNGKDIPKKTFKDLSGQYLHLANKCKLTYFEYLTALAFIYFEKRKVEFVVIETGLGGRFDATNVIKKPLVSIITSIAYDHKEILGNTIKKIAFEKAGIIKKNAEVICGDLSKSALAVIKTRSKPLVFNKDFKAVNVRAGKNTKAQLFDYRGIENNIKDVKISFLGRHQIQNAAMAVCGSEIINKKGFQISGKSVKNGLLRAKWPARFDIRKVVWKGNSFDLIIEGAHNEQAVDAFVKTLKENYKKKLSFVFAVMKEKEYGKIIKKIVPHADRIILMELENSRAVKANDLAKEFSKYIPRKKICTVNSVSGVFEVLKRNETAVVAGSLYLAGEVLKNIKD